MDLITFARDRSASSGTLQFNSKSTGNMQNSSAKLTSIQTSSLSTGISNCGMQSVTGVPMKHLLALTKKKEASKKSPNRIIKSKCLKENHHYVKCEKRTLLQIPDSPKDPKILKSNVSRGSWPGPGVENSGSLLDSSFSKSEQHLNVLGGEILDGTHRKFSDCSSDYMNRENNSHSSIDGSNSFDKYDRRNSDRGAIASKLTLKWCQFLWIIIDAWLIVINVNFEAFQKQFPDQWRTSKQKSVALQYYPDSLYVIPRQCNVAKCEWRNLHFKVTRSLQRLMKFLIFEYFTTFILQENQLLFNFQFTDKGKKR